MYDEMSVLFALVRMLVILKGKYKIGLLHS